MQTNTAVNVINTNCCWCPSRWSQSSDPSRGVWQSIKLCADQHLVKRIPSCKHVEVDGQSTLQFRDASGGTFDSTFGNHLKINCPHAEMRRQSHRCCHQRIDGYELWNRNKHQDKALHETLSWTKEGKRQWKTILGKTIEASSSKPQE